MPICITLKGRLHCRSGPRVAVTSKRGALIYFSIGEYGSITTAEVAIATHAAGSAFGSRQLWRDQHSHQNGAVFSRGEERARGSRQSESSFRSG